MNVDKTILIFRNGGGQLKLSHVFMISIEKSETVVASTDGIAGVRFRWVDVKYLFEGVIKTGCAERSADLSCVLSIDLPLLENRLLLQNKVLNYSRTL